MTALLVVLFACLLFSLPFPETNVEMSAFGTNVPLSARNLLKSGKFEEASEELKNNLLLLENEAVSSDVLVCLSCCYSGMAQWSEALQTAQQALSANAQSVRAHLALARAYHGIGDIYQAIVSCDAGMQIDPTDKPLQQYRGICMRIHEGQPEPDPLRWMPVGMAEGHAHSHEHDGDHEHSHSHDDTHSHSHEHSHVHTTDHDHSHEHLHSHNHTHDDTSTQQEHEHNHHHHGHYH